MARNAFSLQFSFLLFAPCYPVRAKRACFPRNGIKDSLGFWIPLRGFRIPGTGFQSSFFQSVELGFWIPVVSGIPDSLNCIPVPKPRIMNSTSKIFPDFGIVANSLTWVEPKYRRSKPGELQSWEFLVGVCPPGFSNPDPVSDQKCHFPHPFSDQTSKIHTRFQKRQKLCHHYLD